MLKPVRVGRVPPGEGTADRFVMVKSDGRPIMRVDAYAYGPDCFAFEDAIIWQSNLVLGFGSHVHAISLADRRVVTVPLDAYYGHMYPTSKYLLVASGEHLFRMDPDRSIRWKSASLAVDGVVVHDSEPPVIRGAGEWDPPGGWKPFAVLAVDGRATTTG